MSIFDRKKQHLRVALKLIAQRSGVSDWDQFRFVNNCFPEVAANDVDLSVDFCGHKLELPLLIGSMSGGVNYAGKMNRALVDLAAEFGLGFASGSIRILTRNPKCVVDFDLKDRLGSLPYFLNVGAAQLVDPGFLTWFVGMVKRLRADFVFVHLNATQELFQNRGDQQYVGFKDALKLAIAKLPVPVFLKEVGHGLPISTMQEFDQLVSGFDLAGRGGLSFAEVEAYQNGSADLLHLAKQFGVSTIELLAALDGVGLKGKIIAGGSLWYAADLIKALALGADLGAMASRFLWEYERGGHKGLRNFMENYRQELRLGLAALGVVNLSELRQQGQKLIIKSSGENLR